MISFFFKGFEQLVPVCILRAALMCLIFLVINLLTVGSL